MKFSNALRSFWHMPMAVVVAGTLVGGASLASGQTMREPFQAQGTPLTLLLSGPTGSPSTLVYSADEGWRLHAGWDAIAQGSQDTDARPINAALKPPTLPPAEPPSLEHPLTVFIDGPTGFTYMYSSDEGWKFVGQIANASR